MKVRRAIWLASIRQLAVLAENGFGRLVERHDYCAAVFPDGFGRDIFDGAVDHIPTGETQKVADAAADVALEHEHVPLFLQFPGQSLVLLSYRPHQTLGHLAPVNHLLLRSMLAIEK